MALASLRFWRDRFVWTSPRHAGGETIRPTITVLVGGAGELSVGHQGREFRGCALAIGPMTPRSVHADEGFYSLNLDPVHHWCRHLRREYFSREPIWNLGERLSAATRRRVTAAIAGPIDDGEATDLSSLLLAELFPGAVAEAPLDARILAVAARLRAELPARADLAALAAPCELSPGRLTHLFTQEMGVPIKSYLLAMKMRKAAEYFGAGRPLTDIAHAMGFTDSAHLTKAFQAYFSVPPSLLANRELVNLTVCEPD